MIPKYFSGFEQIVYQIRFYEGPAGSLFLYDRGPYTYPPAFNGDIASKTGQLHSFYSEDLDETFWTGFGPGEPNYIEVLGNMLTLIEHRIFKIHLITDIFY